jgi:hypothetical protein
LELNLMPFVPDTFSSPSRQAWILFSCDSYCQWLDNLV